MSENQDALFLAEKKLKQTQKELQEITTEFQNLVYIISHDLRGPLRHASGFGEMVLSINNDTLDDKSKKFLEIIVDSAEGGKKSLDSLQKYTRLIFQDQIFESDININSVLNDLEQALSGVIHQEMVKLQYSELPSIRGDRTQVTNLFECLLRNALLYKTDGEPVSISIECQEDAEVWHFSIADNGIGLANTQLDFVFGVFKRAVKATDYPGAGMGLAMAKKIVERHNGRIWFSPDVSKGLKLTSQFQRSYNFSSR